MSKKNALFIYWPTIFMVATIFIASLIDPSNADALFPFAFDLARLARMLFSPWLILCVIPTVAGIVYARKVWAANESAFSTVDRMVVIWFLMNATWYHIGCDVMSGLFQVMPNLTDGYQMMNRAHFEPMHHPDRVALDAVYWFELFVQMPLCYLTYFLYLKRSALRHGVEAFLCGLHLTGTVAYYLPVLLMGESSHPILSNMDRSIGFLWIVVPAILFVRTTRQSAAAARAA